MEIKIKSKLIEQDHPDSQLYKWFLEDGSVAYSYNMVMDGSTVNVEKDPAEKKLKPLYKVVVAPSAPVEEKKPEPPAVTNPPDTKGGSIVKKLASKYSDLITEDALGLLYSTGFLPKDCPGSVVALMFEKCRLVNINPLHQPFYLIPFNAKEGDRWVTKYAIVTNINTMLTLAHRSQRFAGINEAVYNDNRKSYLILKEAGDGLIILKDKDGKDVICPTTCTVTVYGIVGGVKCEFTSTVTWESRYPGKTANGKEKNPRWLLDPFGMLAKCAKAAALRDAFSDFLQGMYIEEEMEAPLSGDNDIVSRDSIIEEMQAAARNGDEELLKKLWHDNVKFQSDLAFVTGNNEAHDILKEVQKQNANA